LVVYFIEGLKNGVILAPEMGIVTGGKDLENQQIWVGQFHFAHVYFVATNGAFAILIFDSRRRSNTAKYVRLPAPLEKNKDEREKTSLYENSHFGDARNSGKLWWF
jgi:hypothetical protein